jgi:hypothetical protein
MPEFQVTEEELTLARNGFILICGGFVTEYDPDEAARVVEKYFQERS